MLLRLTQTCKTSLLRLIAALHRPSSRKILEDGNDITGLYVRKRYVAMLYQEFVNYPSFTVYENVAAPLRLTRRFDAQTIDAKVKATAELLRIDACSTGCHRSSPAASSSASLSRAPWSRTRRCCCSTKRS